MDEKQLHSLIMLAEKHSHIEFEELHKALGTKSKQELEEVLVEAIHEGTVTVSFGNYFSLCELF
jgi:hypothetical protein